MRDVAPKCSAARALSSGPSPIGRVPIRPSTASGCNRHRVFDISLISVADYFIVRRSMHSARTIFTVIVTHDIIAPKASDAVVNSMDIRHEF